jgi:hypothetical protein
MKAAARSPEMLETAAQAMVATRLNQTPTDAKQRKATANKEKATRIKAERDC